MPWVLRDRAMRGVLAVTLLAGVVDGMVLPFLGITAEERGVSLAAIGAMAAAYLLVQVALQLPLGALSDRIGRAEVVAGGLGLLGLATAGFAFAGSAPPFLLLRVVQGAGVAALLPALRALVADLAPPARRGPAFAAYTAAFTGGIFAGPVLGGWIAEVAGANALFLVTGALAGALAIWVISALRGPRHRRAETVPAGDRVPLRDLLSRPLLGAFLLGGASYVPSGLVNSIWGIYVDDLGASDFEIGLTFSTFALALLVLAPLGGRVAARPQRWRTLLVSFGAFGVLTAAYGLAPNVAWILGLGVAEGMVAAVSLPTLDAYLVSVADPRVQGRAQGAFATAATLGAALTGLAGSVLYGVDPFLPFAAGGALIFAAVSLAIPLIRAAERGGAGGAGGEGL